MKKTKKQKAFDFMQLLIDNNGAEYLSYTGAFGPVKDFSPWLIKEYKQYKSMEAAQ